MFQSIKNVYHLHIPSYNNFIPLERTLYIVYQQKNWSETKITTVKEKRVTEMLSSSFDTRYSQQLKILHVKANT